MKRKDLTRKRGKAEAKPRNVFSKSRQRFGEGKNGHNRDHVHTFQALPESKQTCVAPPIPSHVTSTLGQLPEEPGSNRCDSFQF